MSEPITGNNVTDVWFKALSRLLDTPGNEISPLISTIEGTSEEILSENAAIKDDLNAILREANYREIDTTANTIFPNNFAYPREKIFERYEFSWKIIENIKANRHGTYFRRLSAYQPDGVEAPINQLSHIVDCYKSNVKRRSAYLATIFDATKDHKKLPYLGFPCMQQISFIPDRKNGKLHVTAIYALQYIVDRAYGNYLGIARLGNFMAEEMGLELNKVTCIATVANLGDKGKKYKPQLSALIKRHQS